MSKSKKQPPQKLVTTPQLMRPVPKVDLETDEQRERGDALACPRCGCHHLYVAYTRHFAGRIRRARDCRNCGKRLITHEQISK